MQITPGRQILPGVITLAAIPPAERAIKRTIR
jgi:hypothetical protein